MTPSPAPRRFFLIGIVSITAIIGATATLIWLQRNAAIASYRTATTNLGDGMSQQTSQMIASVDRALTEIQGHLASASDTAREQIQIAMRTKGISDLLIDLKKGLPEVDALAVIDADGVIGNSSGAWSLMGHDVAHEDFFVHFRTYNDHDAFVSMPTKSALSGKWIAYLARRVNDSHGTFAGIVIGEISLASLEEFYSVAMPVLRSVSLLRRDGVVLVRYPPHDDEIGKKIPDHKPWYAVVAQGGGAYHGSDFFTKTQIIAFVRPLKNLPLVVQASVTEAKVLVDWPQQILELLLGGAAAIVAVLLLLRHLATQVNRIERSQFLLATKNIELETTHIQFDAALSNISLGVCLFDGNKKLIICNRSYREIYNLSPDEAKAGTTLAELFDHRFASGSSPRGTREEYLNAVIAVTKTGERREAIVELVSGRAILITHQSMAHGGWIATHEDITVRREADRNIRFLAHHDVLTGLANRAFFIERLDDAMARLQRHGQSFTVFLLDLDKFKNVNDTLGHPAGDELLRQTAQRLKSALREIDVLARLGGDEFAIIQSGEEKPHKGAARLATRILEIFAEPYSIDGNVLSVSTSIGIALAPENVDKSTEMLKLADIALYAAKAAGRNGFAFFDAAMLTAIDSRRQLEDELRVAVSRGGFELYYQALIDTNTRRQVGFEALVRWRHPTRGLILPNDFIPLAEETGLIVPLGAWILKRACADATKWPSHIKVAVNLSPVQLAQPNLLQTVLGALGESSLSAKRLELEITETALFKNDVDSFNSIRQLKRVGVSIVLDDFGTGYSSLSYLTMIPFDKIKIDRSFTINMAKRADCAAIVAAVLAIGRNLKTETVAEGVETEEQFRALRAVGVTFVQGYLFGRPCPASDIVLDDAAATNLTVSAA